jgi:hypothetical protein
MKDTAKIIQDTLDSLSHHPITKGLLPTIGGVGITFIEELEIGFRLAGVVIGVLIGCLTLYVKVRDLYRERKT